MALTVPKGAADVEGLTEEEYPLVTPLAVTTAQRFSRCSVVAATGVAALLLVGVALFAMPSVAADTRAAVRFPALGWVQQLAKANDCDVAKITSTFCMHEGELMEGGKLADKWCDEMCLGVWRDMEANCPKSSKEAEAGTKLLKSCNDKTPLPPKFGHEKEVPESQVSDCDVIMMGANSACDFAKFQALDFSACTEDCTASLKMMKASCGKADAELNQMAELVLGSCGKCGKSFIDMMLPDASSCHIEDGGLDSGDWSPCHAKCHPFACNLVENCKPGQSDSLPGITDKNLEQLQATAKETMKKCPCDGK